MKYRNQGIDKEKLKVKIKYSRNIKINSTEIPKHTDGIKWKMM